MKTKFAALMARVMPVLAVAALAVLSSLPAAAQTTPAPFAYDDLVNGAKTELTSSLTVVGPIVFGILALMCGIGWAWKSFKKATKSS